MFGGFTFASEVLLGRIASFYGFSWPIRYPLDFLSTTQYDRCPRPPAEFEFLSWIAESKSQTRCRTALTFAEGVRLLRRLEMGVDLLDDHPDRLAGDLQLQPFRRSWRRSGPERAADPCERRDYLAHPRGSRIGSSADCESPDRKGRWPCPAPRSRAVSPQDESRSGPQAGSPQRDSPRQCWARPAGPMRQRPALSLRRRSRLRVGL
jgi:hypothetical protein